MPKRDDTTSGVDERARQLQASIADQVAELRSSDEWARHLAFTASFHQYSLNNILLIAAQCPHATQVAGYRAWQDKGRQVRKGERALKIFGRSSKTISNQDGEARGDVPKSEENHRDETTRIVVRYPILSVFDISQTEPIPGREDSSTAAKLLIGEDPNGILAAVTSHLHDAGWALRREPIPGAVNGYATTDGTYQVVIDSHLAPAQAAKTGLHEDAHVTLGHTKEPAEYETHRGLMETEAESVAYVLAGLLGLDTADYSIGYIASWTEGDTTIIKTTAANVLHAVREMAPDLTQRLAPARPRTEHPLTHARALDLTRRRHEDQRPPTVAQTGPHR